MNEDYRSKFLRGRFRTLTDEENGSICPHQIGLYRSQILQCTVMFATMRRKSDRRDIHFYLRGSPALVDGHASWAAEGSSVLRPRVCIGSETNVSGADCTSEKSDTISKIAFKIDRRHLGAE